MGTKLVVLLLLSLGAVSHLAAQSTYPSTGLYVAPGTPSAATFAFIQPLYGQGSTELIVQCAAGRASLIVDYDLYGGQQSSEDFPISCSISDGVSKLNGTPFTVPLVLAGFGAPQNINLTIAFASWNVRSRYGKSVGSAQIAY